jgi:hypothetical protein
MWRRLLLVTLGADARRRDTEGSPVGKGALDVSLGLEAGMAVVTVNAGVNRSRELSRVDIDRHDATVS